MRLIPLVLLVSVSVGAQVPAPAPASKQKPIFRIGIDVRQVDVVVLDENGRPVHGLTAADFTILEDGKPQGIVALEEIVAPEPDPTAADWVRDVPPDVTTNDIPTDGRLIVILMDDAVTRHPTLIEPAKRIGREIVNRMGPADLAAVVYTLQNDKSQDFTFDRRRLLRAIDRFMPGFVESDSRVASASLLEAHFRQGTVRTIAKTAQYLRAIEGRRKALFYVSIGIPMGWSDLSTPVANLGAFEVTVGASEATRDLGVDIKKALEEAALSNVAVYSVSPRGLSVENNSLETDFLRMFAESTGGIAVVDTNEPERRIEPLFTATSAYYLIAYDIQRPDDGRYHRLEVKVNRPGVTVHARKGFYATTPDRAKASDGDGANGSPLATAMAGFLPKGDVPMHASALPFAVAGKAEAGVAILARIEQEPVAKRTVQQVELLTTAFDPNGKAVASKRQTARVTLLPSDTERARYDVLSRIDLKPGRYSLRIAAHNATSRKSGSVFYDVDVPDFRKDGLWMSGVALHVTPGIAAAPRNALGNLVSIVPTTVRSFVSDDAVSGTVQITQGGKKPVVPIQLEVRITDDNGRTVHRASEAVDVQRFASRSVDHRFSLPIQILNPGRYLLTLEATAAGTTARRDVRFTRR
jgi:VWFA-related protein